MGRANCFGQELLLERSRSVPRRFASFPDKYDGLHKASPQVGPLPRFPTFTSYTACMSSLIGFRHALLENVLMAPSHQRVSTVCCCCSFEGDLRVYFQCDGQDRVHLPDITIEVSILAHAHG